MRVREVRLAGATARDAVVGAGSPLVDRLVLVAPTGVPWGRSAAGHAGALLREAGAVPPPFALLLAAERDALVPARMADELARRIPGARRVEIPGTGHVPMYARPDELNRHVLTFLGRAG